MRNIPVNRIKQTTLLLLSCWAISSPANAKNLHDQEQRRADFLPQERSLAQSESEITQFGSTDLTDSDNLAQPLPITYHGGPVMSNSPYLYLIFYGAFSNSTTPDILSDLIRNQQGLPYWTTLKGYYSMAGGQKFYITKQPRFGAVAYDTSYSEGAAISDTSVFTIVTNAIKARKLPLNSNAIYIVVTSADVNATSGMCTKYCGWHTSRRLGAQIIRYSYIGSPLRCPGACGYNQGVTPNNNKEADGMANIIMHEIGEVITDPDINAWFDATYYENADKCSWTWGTKYATNTGAHANMKIGNRDFLIQQTWVNPDSGYCGLSFP